MYPFIDLEVGTGGGGCILAPTASHVQQTGNDMSDREFNQLILRNAPDRAGETIHIHHCKPGKDNDRLFITRADDGRGVLGYCHHCHTGARVQDYRNARVIKPAEALRGNGPRLPPGSLVDPQDWPPEARIWLHEARIGTGTIQSYGIVYDPYTRRVLLPVRHAGGTQGYISRKIFPDDDLPRYLANIPNRKYRYVHLDVSRETSVVLVEDPLSAIRVRELRTPVVGLLGTGLSDHVLNVIISRYKKFLIWFDNDNPEVKHAQLDLKKRLELFGDSVIIRTDKDPKRHTRDEMENVLNLYR